MHTLPTRPPAPAAHLSQHLQHGKVPQGEVPESGDVEEGDLVHRREGGEGKFVETAGSRRQC